MYIVILKLHILLVQGGVIVVYDCVIVGREAIEINSMNLDAIAVSNCQFNF